MLHDQMQYFFRGFRRDAASDGYHGLPSSVALSAFYHDSLDIQDEEQRKLASIRMVAKMLDDCRASLQVRDRTTLRLAAQRFLGYVEDT